MFYQTRIMNTAPGNNHLRFAVLVNIVLFTIQAVIYLTPRLNRLLHYDVRGVLFVLWALSTLFLNIKVSALFKEKHLVWFMIYTIWILLMSLIGHSARPFMVQLATLPVMAIPFVGFIAVNSYNAKEQGLLLRILFLIISLNLLSNIYIGIINPQYFDIEHMEGTDAYFSNAGSTSFVASLSFLTIVLLILLFNIKKSSKKFPIIIAIALISFYLFLLNPRATTLILLVFAAISILLIHRAPKSPKLRRSYYFRTGTLLLIITLVALLPLVSFLGNVDNERLSARFSDIGVILQGGSINSLDDGSLAGRFLLGMTSLNTFIASIPNFIWGVGDNILIGEQYEFYDLLSLGIGNHSQFLDTLAKYGIIGGVIFINIVLGISRWLKRISVRESYYQYIDLFILVFFLQSILNNSFLADIFIIIFVVFPLLIVSNNREYETITNKR